MTRSRSELVEVGGRERARSRVEPRTRLVESLVEPRRRSLKASWNHGTPSLKIEVWGALAGVEAGQVLVESLVEPRSGLVERRSWNLGDTLEPRTPLVESLVENSGFGASRGETRAKRVVSSGGNASIGSGVEPRTRLVEEERGCGARGVESDHDTSQQNPGTGAGSSSPTRPTGHQPTFNEVVGWFHSNTTNNNTVTRTAQRGAGLEPRRPLVENGGVAA